MASSNTPILPPPRKETASVCQIYKIKSGPSTVSTFEDERRLDNLFEDFAFVDHVGEAAGSGFLLEFGSGPVAFFGEEFVDSGPERFEFGQR